MPNRGQTPSTSVPLAQLLAMSNDHLARPSRMLNDYIDPYEAVCTKKNKMRRSIAETVCPAGWARRWRDFPSRSYLTSIDKVLTKTRSCVSYDTDITQVLTWVTVDLNMVCVVWRGVGWSELGLIQTRMGLCKAIQTKSKQMIYGRGCSTILPITCTCVFWRLYTEEVIRVHVFVTIVVLCLGSAKSALVFNFKGFADLIKH